MTLSANVLLALALADTMDAQERLDFSDNLEQAGSLTLAALVRQGVRPPHTASTPSV